MVIIEQHSVFKTATIVYKILQDGYPKYFSIFLNPKTSYCNTQSSQMDGEVSQLRFHLYII